METYQELPQELAEIYPPLPKTKIDPVGLSLEEVRLKCINDFAFYSYWVKGRPLQDFHLEWCRQWESSENFFILAPRGSLKSSILSRDYSEWLIIRNPQVRILICSNNAKVAWALIRECQGTFEGNKTFIKLFGNLRGNPWSRYAFDVKPAIKMMEHTMMSTGVPGALSTGLHPDLIIIDDVVDEENSRTDTTRDRVEDWILMTLPGMMKRGTMIKGVGTRYHPLDLYSKFIAPGGQFEGRWKRYQALLQPDTPDEESFWEAWFPLRAREAMPDLELPKVTMGLLDLREFMGTSRFNAQYQNDIEAMKGDIIKEEWLNNYWYEDGNPPYCLPKPGDFYISEGADLAISEKDDACYFVWIRILVHKETCNIYVDKIIRGRFSFDEQFAIVVDNWHDGYQGVKAWVVNLENHNYEIALSNKILDKTIVPVNAVNHTKVGKIYERSMELQPLFENGKVFMHPKKHEQLKAELLNVPKGKPYDCVDAFYNAVQGIKKRVPLEVYVGDNSKIHRIFAPEYGEYPPISLIET